MFQMPGAFPTAKPKNSQAQRKIRDARQYYADDQLRNDIGRLETMSELDKPHIGALGRNHHAVALYFGKDIAAKGDAAA